MARTVDFEAFVVEHEGPLLRTAYLLTGDPGSAEELLATALAATHRHWPWRRRWCGDAADAVRRAMVCALLRRADQPRDDAGPPPPDRDTEEFRRALRDLPPRTRAALVLRLHDSLAEADAADVLGCSPGTVAALIEEATAALRGVGHGEPPAPAAAPSSPGAARTKSPEPDDDAIYRRPR